MPDSPLYRQLRGLRQVVAYASIVGAAIVTAILRLRQVVAYASIVGAAIVTAILLWTLSWNAPLSAADPEPIFSIGPLAPGDSVEQEFNASPSYLTGLEIFVRADSDKDLPVALVMRLREGRPLLREGRLLARVSSDITSVRWDFPPIPQIHGRQFSLQIVIGESTQAPIYVMASLTDKLPGGAITNGIPTGDHIDASLRPWRSIQRLDVLRVAAFDLPGGWLGLVASTSILTVVLAYSITWLIPGNRSRDLPRGSRFIAALIVAVLVMVLALHDLETNIVPELNSGYWVAWIKFAGLLIAALLTFMTVMLLFKARMLIFKLSRIGWGYLVRYFLRHYLFMRAASIASRIRLVGLALGRTAKHIVLIAMHVVYESYITIRRSFGGNRELLLASTTFVAFGLSFIAIVTNIMEGPSARHITIPILEDGVSFEGSLNILHRGQTISFPKYAGIAWLLVAAGSLWLRLIKPNFPPSP
ncbi:MAG: hypothetical protein QF719_00690 [Chloroflexota bacterium]|jgi:hypothetical protein|nr:hypothetical protein [Chloroflexota bacterium]